MDHEDDDRSVHSIDEIEGEEDETAETNDDTGISAQLYIRRDHEQELLKGLIDKLQDPNVFDTMSVQDLRIRLSRMQRHFDLFEAADMEYRGSSLLLTNNVYQTMEEEYMVAVGLIQTRLDAVDTHDHNRTLSSTDYENRGTIIKVETTQPPQLGTFSGNPAEWPAFRDLFLSDVDSRAIDPVAKLRYLQQACKGKAAMTLGPWRPTAENYKPAWEMLVKAYDDSYHVIQF